MIKVIADKKTYTVQSASELSSHLTEMFPADPRSDVMLTYIINSQPTSRRMATEAPVTPPPVEP